MRFKVNLDGGFGEAVSVSASLVKSSSIAPDAVFLSAENDKVKVESFRLSRLSVLGGAYHEGRKRSY